MSRRNRKRIGYCHDCTRDFYSDEDTSLLTDEELDLVLYDVLDATARERLRDCAQAGLLDCFAFLTLHCLMHFAQRHPGEPPMFIVGHDLAKWASARQTFWLLDLMPLICCDPACQLPTDHCTAVSLAPPPDPRARDEVAA